MNHTDRNVLFGVLAVQMNFVSRDAVIAALRDRALENERPLGEVLVEQGALTLARHGLLEQLVDEQLLAHEGDALKSLAAVGGYGEICGDLRALVEPDFGATLNRIPVGGEAIELESEAALTYSVNLPAHTDSRFSILRPHAKGGVGQVSVALDLELHREVALKEIRPEHADNPCSRARFLLEAELTGRLEHPGVVPVYGLGCDAEGRPRYAMRFVRGESLQDAIKRFHETTRDAAGDPTRWNLALRQLLNRFVAVCNVVAYAHSRGVIHRDLKPANILLGPFGETLLVDWGLAKVVGRSEPAAGPLADEASLRPATYSGSTESLAGTAMGTPAYMGPEQAEGRPDRVGPHSDVYSLGATLYCLLTGQPPFDDPDVAVLLRKAKGGEVVPPRQVNRRVPPGLEAICLKAMSLNPADRYSSARALADDLEQWLADEPVAVYREPISIRLSRWGRRHRTLATGLAVLLLTAVVGLTLGTILLGRANERTERQRAFADLQWRRAELKTREASEKAQALERQLYVHRVNLAQREALTDVAAAERLLDQCPVALRGWEWAYTRRFCHLERRTLRGHKRSVNAVAFSPDGRLIVSGAGERYNGAQSTDDVELTLWDAQSGRELRSFPGLKGGINSVGFSADGKLIAVGSGYQRATNQFEGQLSVWDAASGRRVFDRLEGGNNVLGVAFSPDGRMIGVGYGTYSSSNPGRFKLWEAKSGKELHSIATPPGGINSVAFSPDGRLIALASSGVVELWELCPLKKVRELRGHTSWVYGAAFSPDGKRVATGGWDKTIKLWETATGTLLLTGEGHSSIVTGVAFSPDGKRLASSSEDSTLRVWDAATGRALFALRGHATGITGLAFSPDGKTIGSSSQDKLVKLWDATAEYPITFHDHKGWVNSVAFSPDGRKVVSGSSDQTLMIWDPTNGRRLKTFDKHVAWVPAGRFTADGRIIASAAIYPPIMLWDADTLRVVRSLNWAFFPACLVISPDGRRLAVGSAKAPTSPDQAGTVQIWEIPSGQELLTYRGHAGGVMSLAFSPDGKTIASVGGDRHRRTGEVKLWEAATGREIRTLEGHTDVVGDVAFHPAGQLLATCSQDTTVKLWDLMTGQLRQTLSGHTEAVESLAFSPDGARLATGSQDTTIKLWDVATGDTVVTLGGHSAGVVCLAFSPDGRRLASGSIDWTARVWDATSMDESGER